MTTRKAILIGNSGGYRGLQLLTGVSADLTNYETFLTSKAGGQWYQHEISVLRDPDSNLVINEVTKASADYVLIAFSGHGYIHKHDSSDHICLSDKDIPISKIVAPSKKQLLIVDACREVVEPASEQIVESLARLKYAQSTERNTRDIFDQEIQRMPEGILILYSAKAGQTAGEDELHGGHFTYSLLKAGNDWWNGSGSHGVLRVNSASEKATKITRDIFTTTQEPTMGGQVRRLTFPPFAISKQ